MTVALRVTDDQGATSIATTSIAVLNVAPTVQAGANQTVNEGDHVALSGTFTDPGSGETYAASWQVTKDGQLVAQGQGSSLNFVASASGTYLATFTVNDGQGGIGTGSLTVTALNVAPTVQPGANQTVNEGDHVALSGTFTDPGLGETYAASWQVTKDGQLVAQGQAQASTSWPPSGTYLATFTVDDGQGGIGTGSLTVTALNIAPTVQAGANQTVNEGDHVALSGTFTDPGSGETYAASWQVTKDGQLVAQGQARA